MIVPWIVMRTVKPSAATRLHPSGSSSRSASPAQFRLVRPARTSLRASLVHERSPLVAQPIGVMRIVLLGACVAQLVACDDGSALNPDGSMADTAADRATLDAHDTPLDGMADTPRDVMADRPPACGGPGLRCCPPLYGFGNGSCADACCLGGICIEVGSTCGGGFGTCERDAFGSPACTVCGDVDQPCCDPTGVTCPGPVGDPGDPPPGRYTCGADGLCVECGDTGQPCCGTVCYGGGCCTEAGCIADTMSCGGSLGTCHTRECDDCGHLGQSCCDGIGCYPRSPPAMQCELGTCSACGAEGEPCCEAGTCHSNLACGDGRTCVSCGDLGEPCCGSTCASGLACGTAGTCEGCGGVDQPCCPGDQCASGGCCEVHFRPFWHKVCTPDGGMCVSAPGQCNGGSCESCTGGSCRSCGGAGQSCCGFPAIGTWCTASLAECTTTGCAPCGQTGQSCCGVDFCVSPARCDGSTCH